jgi:hypothetical protein
MRRFILLILALLIACRNLPPQSQAPAATTVSVTSTLTVVNPSSAAQPAPVASLVSSTPASMPFSPASYTIHLHPEGGLYIGDQVSIEIIPPAGADLIDKSIQVEVSGKQDTKLGPVTFSPYGLGDRLQATLLWAWDTRGLTPGNYNLTFTLLPDGQAWSKTVILQPANAVSPPEPQAQWSTIQSNCCVIYFITGTAAERDIHQIMSIADSQAADAAQRMGVSLSEPITITLLPRVLGNGGFNSQDVSVSYLDRNFTSFDFAILLHHEMIHALDGRMGGGLRPTILQEGLAVYLSGGHFRSEPIITDAATLLQIYSPIPLLATTPRAAPSHGSTAVLTRLGWFLPLHALADNFYGSQHEVSYLEAAALVSYLIERWGWNSFIRFYRDIHVHGRGSQADAINAALQAHFDISLDGLQKIFLDRLRQEQVSLANIEDVEESVAYFDAMRRYQQVLDPSSYFLTAWLLDNSEMRKKGIVADYVRYPSTPDNLALETMLIAADQDWLDKNYSAEDQMLAVVNGVLDGLERKSLDPFDVDPLAQDYQAIVQVLLDAGYQPQRIYVTGDTALAWITASGPLLKDLILLRTGRRWIINTIKGESLHETFSLSSTILLNQ